MTKKVLIIDDEMEQIFSSMQIIEKNFESYSVLGALRGEKGVEIAQEAQPDIIISDWQMPEMSGIETIKKLKQMEETKNIPVIMITGVMISAENLREALKAGAIDYLQKPVREAELVARIESALRLFDYFNRTLEAQKKIIQLQKENYEVKIRELVQVGLEMERRNKSLQSVRKSLDDALEMLNYSGKELENVNKTFNEQFTPEKDQQKFLELFSGIEDGFIERLVNRYPNLTYNEQKLCVYAKLGLNIQQMSEVLNISYDSARTNRSRLRKKLGIPGNVHLQNFFAEL